MSVWFGRSVFERARRGGEEIGAAVEKGFCALSYEEWCGSGRILEYGWQWRLL